MKFCLFQITGTSPVNNYELIYPLAKTEVTFVLKETKNWKDSKTLFLFMRSYIIRCIYRRTETSTKVNGTQ